MTPSRTLQTSDLLFRIQVAAQRGRDRHAYARAAWEGLTEAERAEIVAELPDNIERVFGLHRGLAIREACNWRGIRSVRQGHADIQKAAESGLVAAFYGFDVTRGFRFSTYATWAIRSTILTECYQLRPLSQSGEVTRAQLAVKRAEEALRRETGETPTDDKLAERTGLRPVAVKRVRAIPEVVELDVMLSGEWASAIDELPDEFNTEQLAERRAYARLTSMTRAEMIAAGQGGTHV